MKIYNKKEIIKNQTYDQERALYGQLHTELIDCVFAGVHDGESPLKESKDISIIDTTFQLRYPLWHVETFLLVNSDMNQSARAPIWYSSNGLLNKVSIGSVKCIRECNNITVLDSKINSDEAFWYSKDIIINDSDISGEYLLLNTNNVKISKSTLSGKYGLQYIKNATIEDSQLEMKDAFWHSEDITVKDSKIEGAYLGWYSKNLTLINCEITGTQPFCYCENLTMINCTMKDTDLSFEHSSIDVDVNGSILSIKNPKSGTIRANHIGQIIFDEYSNKLDTTITLKEE